MYTKPTFPDVIWDGLSSNTWRQSRADRLDPNPDDWDQIVSEMLEVQRVVIELRDTGGPSGPQGETGPTGPSGKVGATGPSGGGSSFLSQGKVYFDGNQIVPAAVPTKITFNCVSFDNNSEWDVMNNRFVVKETGIYCVIGCIHYPNLVTVGGLQLLKNVGSPPDEGALFVWMGDTSGSGRQIQGVTTTQLNAGDYVEMWGTHMKFPSITLFGGESTTFLGIHRIG